MYSNHCEQNMQKPICTKIIKGTENIKIPRNLQNMNFNTFIIIIIFMTIVSENQKQQYPSINGKELFV